MSHPLHCGAFKVKNVAAKCTTAMTKTGLQQQVSNSGVTQSEMATYLLPVVVHCLDSVLIQEAAQGIHVYHVSVTGHIHHISATGHIHHISATGHIHHISVTGHIHHISVTGHIHHISVTGHIHHISATGHIHYISATGQIRFLFFSLPKYTVIITAGHKPRWNTTRSNKLNEGVIRTFVFIENQRF